MSDRVFVDEMAVRRELKHRCDAEEGGGIFLFADQCGVMASAIFEMIEGRKTLSDRVCEALGYSRVTRYERVGE